MPRTRTTKKLAQRIDLYYFERPHSLRRLRFVLSVAAPVLAVLWLAWAGLARDHRPYRSGPMSSAHAVFGTDCSACHVSQAGQFQRAAEDRACLACHDGPIHHPNQVFTPRCTSCHVEHQGRVILAHTRDTACTQCHASLQTRGGPPRFVRMVEGFNTLHPEFAPLRPGYLDPGTIKLNHAVHLRPGLRGPDGRSVQLDCSDCHRPPAVKAVWRFGTAESRAVAASEPRDPLAPEPTCAYMAPVTYARSCATCHSLLFDERFAEPVPHDRPDVVHAFVVRKLQEYIARHPEELRRASRPAALLPERPLPAAPRMLSPREWVAQHAAEAEDLLWRKTCKECHSLSQAPGAALPVVAKSAITLRWLPHARFDHQAHQMLACASCHAAALTSRETSDVLLPGIATCQQCHHPGDEAAEARCFECHTYHDWSQRKEIQGKYTIPRLVRGAPATETGDSTRRLDLR